MLCLIFYCRHIRDILFPLDEFTLPLDRILMRRLTSMLAFWMSTQILLLANTLSHESLFFSLSPADLVILRWAYKKSRELARRLRSFRGDLVVGHPQFKPDSNAATSLTASPVDLSAPNIIYTKEDDDAIDEYHRKAGQSWNSLLALPSAWTESHMISWNNMALCKFDSSWPLTKHWHPARLELARWNQKSKVESLMSD